MHVSLCHCACFASLLVLLVVHVQVHAPINTRPLLQGPQILAPSLPRLRTVDHPFNGVDSFHHSLPQTAQSRRWS